MHDFTRHLCRSPFLLALAGVVVLIAPIRASTAQLPTLPAAPVLSGGTLASQPPAACQPSWSPTFGGQPGTNDPVAAFAVFDDGGGPALYVGGSFTSAGSAAVSYIAKWNGSSWAQLGSGVDGAVYAMTVFNDGSGPALYAGGHFTTAGGVVRRIARWNGSYWSPLGTGMNGDVSALTVFNDGSGPALYVGGAFTNAGGVLASHVAKWDGTSWYALGTGMNGDVSALTVFNDGSGPALYAGGKFTSAGGVPVNYIAKLNGSTWSPLGSGMNFFVFALTVFDGGAGPALYAGGMFSNAGGVAANRIAKWNGSSWLPLGSGMQIHMSNPVVNSLVTFDDGAGLALYAGGSFTAAGGVPASNIAKWDGSSWSALASGITDPSPNSYVDALAVFDDGSGSELYAGGYFQAAGGVGVSNIAKWNGASWSTWGGGGLNRIVFALSAFDDGSGSALYAGGVFTSAVRVEENYIVKWNGSSWSSLGSGMNDSVHALTVFDDGSGTALYAGGYFTTADGAAANYIAKWNGTSWSPLGSGINGPVYALTVFDDGSGPALYAGGYFTTAGGVAANDIAKWNGSSWAPLASGTTGQNSYVDALAMFDDGSGPALYAGGHFAAAGGVAANDIAKWNGASWAPLGSGVNDLGTPTVDALTVFDDGAGPALYAGGLFTNVGGVTADYIAKWNGASWSALGSGTNFEVEALGVFDDGSAPALYAGGSFITAGGVTARNIAKWNGASWSSLGAGMNDYVDALAVFDDGSGPALYAGGGFSLALDSGDSYLAKWSNPSGCGAPGSSMCEPGASGVIACPCNNAPATSGLGCNNSSNTGGAQLAATGIARLTYDTVVFTTSGEKPTATSIVLQGDNISSSGVVFGQGVRCVAGTLKRLYVKAASGGSITAPQGADLHVHARSTALGDTIAPGTHRYYGVYYRDPTVLGGCPASSTFNITQQLDVLWAA